MRMTEMDMEAALEFKAPLEGDDLTNNITKILTQIDPNDSLKHLASSSRLLVAACAIMYRAERNMQAIEQTTAMHKKLKGNTDIPDSLRKYASVSLMAEVASIIEMYSRGEFIVE